MMNICIYNFKSYEEEAFELLDKACNKLTKVHQALNKDNTYLAAGSDVVVVLTNDCVNEIVITQLKALGIKLICTRSTGYDNIDLEAAKKYGITVANVPSYSPESIAEHSIMLILTLCKKFKKSQNQIYKNNFDLEDLVSKNLGEQTVGIIGTGEIGKATIKILKGFGCKILAFDIAPDHNIQKLVDYVDLSQLLTESDIVSLYVPLNPNTKYLIDKDELSLMKEGALLINVARGAVINTKVVIEALLTNRLAGLAMDVYENESDIFFRDHGNRTIEDPLLVDLLKMEQVVVTGHQAYLTQTSIYQRALITMQNIKDYKNAMKTNNFITWNEVLEFL